MQLLIVKTTFPNQESAKNLANILLTKKLAACIQFEKIHSSYLWQEKIENEEEISLSIKTDAKFFERISEIIQNNHPYDIAQIYGINVDQVSQSYENWIVSNLTKDKIKTS